LHTEDVKYDWKTNSFMECLALLVRHQDMKRGSTAHLMAGDASNGLIFLGQNQAKGSGAAAAMVGRLHYHLLQYKNLALFNNEDPRMVIQSLQAQTLEEQRIQAQQLQTVLDQMPRDDLKRQLSYLTTEKQKENWLFDDDLRLLIQRASSKKSKQTIHLVEALTRAQQARVSHGHSFACLYLSHAPGLVADPDPKGNGLYAMLFWSGDMQWMVLDAVSRHITQGSQTVAHRPPEQNPFDVLRSDQAAGAPAAASIAAAATTRKQEDSMQDVRLRLHLHDVVVLCSPGWMEHYTQNETFQRTFWEALQNESAPRDTRVHSLYPKGWGGALSVVLVRSTIE
jgi:hypothetical protein